MPLGKPAGWTQTFSDDFPGVAVDKTKWGPYDGIPTAYPRTMWRPENAVVSGGEVKLAA